MDTRIHTVTASIHYGCRVSLLDLLPRLHHTLRAAAAYATEASNPGLAGRVPGRSATLTRLSLALGSAVTAMGKEADAAPASDGGDFCGF